MYFNSHTIIYIYLFFNFMKKKDLKMVLHTIKRKRGNLNKYE